MFHTHTRADSSLDSLLPALASRGTRELLHKILDVFFTRQSSEHFAFAKAAYEYLIGRCSSKLVLGGVNLGYFKTREREAFVALLDQSLRIGATEQAMHLLEASSHELEVSAPSKLGRHWLKDIVSELLVPMALRLEHCGLSSISLPVARAFFVTIIRGCFLRQLLRAPPIWAYEESYRCDLEGDYCYYCNRLGDFLRSETQKKWKFYGDETGGKHIAQVLSRYGGCFECNTSSPNELDVTKKKPMPTNSVLIPLQGDTMRTILGDDCYRKLILLEDMKVDEDNIIAKRQADEAAVDGEVEKKKLK